MTASNPGFGRVIYWNDLFFLLWSFFFSSHFACLMRFCQKIGGCGLRAEFISLGMDGMAFSA